MPLSDITSIIQWWATILFIGIIATPVTIRIFPSFFDKGYIFGKILGIVLLSYILFVLGELRLVPFSALGSYIVLYALAGLSIYFVWRNKKHFALLLKSQWKLYILYEILFFSALFFWSFVRGHQPDVNGLEKFMDFGFVNSILRGTYFPPQDMWLSHSFINYYYFGHLATAVLIRLSGVTSAVGFNLMIATIFAFCLTASFSLGGNLFYHLLGNGHKTKKAWSRIFLGSGITAFLVTFAGNLHTLYTFFKAYPNDNPVPLWQLPLQLASFPNSYWYPNATRFIYHTIHEFPMYSFVVSDLHGHVLDIPFVLLTLAVFLSILVRNSFSISYQLPIKKLHAISYKPYAILTGFFLAIMYMTNAWDGLIYFMLAFLLICYHWTQKLYTEHLTKNFVAATIFIDTVVVGISTLFFSLPFSLFFKPFASGVGVVCPADFLIKIGQIGPLVFEKDHCMRSPAWQLGILYGFFYFWVFSFLIFLIIRMKKKWEHIHEVDIFVMLLILCGTILIIVPEFVYLKDIYATYFRANTMFKLVYQSFIMLSLASGYIIIRLFSLTNKKEKLLLLPYILLGSFFIALVSIYPYFAVTSYYDNLKVYKGLDGIRYLKTTHPDEAKAIDWINENIQGQPTLLEAQGDSYTDYNLVSANTGLPTVLGWTVHEWLWRNSYDIIPQKQTDIQKIYETDKSNIAWGLIKQYDINYVFIGHFEKQKYKVKEEKFNEIGEPVYRNNTTVIYKIKQEKS